jgi:hypothetical protein
MNTRMTETEMTEIAELQCCAREAELDRLICRMAVHESYGATTPLCDHRERPIDEGDAR